MMPKSAGFTIFEMVMIIIVIAVIAVTVSVRMPAIEPIQVEGFSDVFKSDIRYTSVLAMSNNDEYKIVVGTNSYQIQDKNGTIINHPEVGAASITSPSGVTISPATTLTFTGAGYPKALASQLNFSVTSNGSTRIVSVSPETGFVQ